MSFSDLEDTYECPSEEELFQKAYSKCLRGKTASFERLLKAGVNDINRLHHNKTFLMLACIHGHNDIAKRLIEDTRIDVNAEEKDGSTALFYACIYEEKQILKLLLKKEEIDMYKGGPWSPLMACCYVTDPEITYDLLRHMFISDPRFPFVDIHMDNQGKLFKEKLLIIRVVVILYSAKYIPRLGTKSLFANCFPFDLMNSLSTFLLL